MKISFFIGGMCRGGAERVISILADDYCQRGWDVEIVMLLRNEVEYPLDSRIRLVAITGKYDSYPQNALHWFRGIRKYLQTARPDRVVSFVGRINALVLTSALGLGLPIVVSERNDPKHDGRGGAMLWYCNKIYRLAKRIVYQNAYEQSCFDPALTPKSCIIPNPVAVKCTAAGQRSHRVVTAGRLMPQKNQKMLIDAFAKFHDSYPVYKLDIYGEGPLQAELQQRIDSLGLTDAITLRGNVSNIHQEIADAEMFVLSSDFEGLSNALLEAMMMGHACISTNCAGSDEAIQNGENGLLVPVGDQRALTAAMEQLAADPELAAKLGNAAKETAQQYTVDRVIDQWRKAIEG